MRFVRARGNKKPTKMRKLLKLALTVVVAAGIFVLGWGTGSGRIAFGPGAVFRKSVNKNLPAHLDYSSVQEVYDKLRSAYDGQLDQTKLLDGLKAGLAKASGDPYTQYLNQDEAKSFDEQLTGSFTGIGAELSIDQNVITVVAPLAGYPADKAGLRPKDIIAEIDGKSTFDMTISDAVQHIRGPKGTQVKLKIVRNNKDQLTFTITRDEITIPSVDSKILDGNIGYLHISRFGEDTTKLSRQAAADFKKANVKGVVLDLRSDPGGLLDAAVDVSSLWLNDQTVLTERRDGVIIRTYQAEGTPVLNGIPTAVLIDAGSASASEITAGALRDNKVATLIGAKSFGKGSVQQLENLKGGGVLKVTVARWYTPSGHNINKEGITPDQKVDRTDDDYKSGKDPQLDTATQYIKTRFVDQ